MHELGENHSAKIQQAIHIFQEFGAYSHIHVPKFQVIRAALYEEDKHDPYLFIVDFIQGESFPIKKFLPHEK